MVYEFDSESNALKKAAGLKEPSSETAMHSLIYATRPDVGAIIHVHDRALMSEKAVAKLRLPVTDNEHAYGTREIAGAVAALIAKSDAAVARGHGIVVVGKSIDDAAQYLVKLERRAP
jgi:L-fuculose-phosphate aldolase